MATKIYHYSSKTGELLAQGFADENPLDKSQPLIPANATILEPQNTTNGKTVIFDGSSWSLIDDYRGRLVYDKSNPNESKEIKELGAIPDGWTLKEPPEYSVWNVNAQDWEYSQELERPDKEASVRSQRDTIVDRVSREINRLEDAGKDATAWRQYRVALRNVPEQEGFPFDITWPEQPADYTGK